MWLWISHCISLSVMALRLQPLKTFLTLTPVFVLGPCLGGGEGREATKKWGMASHVSMFSVQNHPIDDVLQWCVGRGGLRSRTCRLFVCPLTWEQIAESVNSGCFPTPRLPSKVRSHAGRGFRLSIVEDNLWDKSVGGRDWATLSIVAVHLSHNLQPGLYQQ